MSDKCVNQELTILTDDGIARSRLRLRTEPSNVVDCEHNRLLGNDPGQSRTGMTIGGSLGQ